MELVVQYMVPVSVFVDTETGEVVRVLQENQNIIGNDIEPVVDPSDSWTSNNIDDAAIETAIDIAESNDWPVWDQA